MLVVSEDVLAAIVEHARGRLPLEACGLIAGPPGGAVVDHFFPVHNVAASDRAFLLDPQQMLDAERRADRSGLEIKGVMHSHPTTEAFPSPTDVSDASNFDPFGSLRSVIVSLASNAPTIRCFRISAGEIDEEDVVRG